MPRRKKARTVTVSLSPSSQSSVESGPSRSRSRSPALRRHDPPERRSQPSRSAAATTRNVIIGDTDSSSSSESDAEPVAVPNRLSRGRSNKSKKIHQTGDAATTTKTKTTPKTKKAKIQKSPGESLPRAIKSLKKSPASRNIMDYFNKVPKNKPEPDGDKDSTPKANDESMELFEHQPDENEDLTPTSESKVNGYVNGVSEHSEDPAAIRSDSEESGVSSPASPVSSSSNEEVPYANGVVESESTSPSPSTPGVEIVETSPAATAEASPAAEGTKAETKAEIESVSPDVIECLSTSQLESSSEPSQKTTTRKPKTKAEGKEKDFKSIVPETEPEPELGRRRSSRIAMQRNIRSYFISDKPDRPYSPESSPEPPKSKRKSLKEERRKAGASKGKKSTSNNSQSSSASSSQQQKPQSQVTRALDKATREFLYSGVPSTILKAQRQAEKKREQDSWLEVAQFFPRVSHVHSFDNVMLEVPPTSMIPSKFNPAPEPDFPETEVFQIGIQSLREFLHKHVHAQSESRSEHTILAALSCCPIRSSLKPNSNLPRLLANVSHQDPFVLKYAPVEDLSALAVDPSAVQQFSCWLQTWKDDITESGGASRRQLPEKRKRRGSDSDFVTSDEDEGGVSNSERKKSVVMYGPTGCGKSALIYTIATMLGFKVVEINFSTRRSGREVMEMVEEATLSRRLHEKGNGGDGEGDDDSSAEESESDSDSDVELQEESQGSSGDSQNQDPRPCLLLFEDVNLVQEEEDEGFHRAIVQLIQSTVRPIVMTISTSISPCAEVQNEESTRISLSWTLDPKIEKTCPLWIGCKTPRTVAIVKALQRVVRSEFELSDDDFEDEYIHAVLGTIAQHAGGDIRRAVNQLQFYMNADWFLDYDKMHQDLSAGIVQDFEQQINQPPNDGSSGSEFSATTNTKEEKIQNIKKLATIAGGCSLLADLDCISTAENRLESESECERGWQPRRFELAAQSNFIRYSERKQASASASGVPVPAQYYTSLLYEPVSRQDSRVPTQQVRSQLIEYLDDERDFEAVGWLRTIVKQSILNSLGNEGAYGGRAGSSRRRNGRVKHYFNRMSHELIGQIETTLDFRALKQEAAQVQKAVDVEMSTATSLVLESSGV